MSRKRCPKAVSGWACMPNFPVLTPLTEVDLCGHAALATAWVLLCRLEQTGDSITFHTRSGPLAVSRDGARLVMDFPAQPPTEAVIDNVTTAPGAKHVAVLASLYAIAVMESQDIARLPCHSRSQQVPSIPREWNRCVKQVRSRTVVGWPTQACTSAQRDDPRPQPAQ